MDTEKTCRFPWDGGFPDVWIHAQESAVKRHPAYSAAKAGDADAAQVLVDCTLNLQTVLALAQLGELGEPCIVTVHAEESIGVNAIPEVLGDTLSYLLAWKVEKSVVQKNIVKHTGADGISRMARQASFKGDVTPDRRYLIVDDFVGQGGTIANLRGSVRF